MTTAVKALEIFRKTLAISEFKYGHPITIESGGDQSGGMMAMKLTFLECTKILKPLFPQPEQKSISNYTRGEWLGKLSALARKA